MLARARSESRLGAGAPTGAAARGVPANSGTRSASAESSTPTVRAAARTSLFWVLAGAGALLVAIVATLLAAGSVAGGRTLAADNASPDGGRALVEVLRQQGVTVTVAGTLKEARAAVARSDDPTVFVYDEDGFLDSDRLDTLAGLAPRTIVADPDFSTLRALAPEVGFGGLSDVKPLAARCSVPAAVAAGSLSPDGDTLTLPPDAAGAGPAVLHGCFPGGANRFSVIERSTSDRTLTLLADPTVFSNDKIGTWGNAALALNLLGPSDTLVWYLPTIGDLARTGPASLGELTPGWVTPVLVLLVLVTLAAALWRGRRFGPLVAENLPVTVKASETMEGRARLYARANARLRAIDALRIGAVQRLARHVGLGRSARLDDVILSVAAITGRAPDEVRAVLVDAVPAGDRDLVGLSDRLRDLERATISAAAPPAQPTPAVPAPPPPRPSTGQSPPPNVPPHGRMDP